MTGVNATVKSVKALVVPPKVFVRFEGLCSGHTAVFEMSIAEANTFIAQLSKAVVEAQE